MRYLLLLTLFFSIQFSYCQDKNLELTYTYEIKDFSNSLDNNNQYKSYFSDKIKKFNQLSEYLFIRVVSNKTNYIVTFEDILGTDHFTETEISALKSLALPFSPVYAIENTIYTKNNLIDNILIKFMESEILDWKITSEKKYIMNYECYKAIPENVTDNFKGNTSLIPVEIWFSPEINYKASPSIYSNIPGAILEMNYKTFDIKLHNIKYTTSKLDTLETNDYTILSHQKFLNLIKRDN
jgi:GLPGLI family protein